MNKNYQNTKTNKRSAVVKQAIIMYDAEGFACDAYGRDLEMRRDFEKYGYCLDVDDVDAEEHRDIQIDYGCQPTLFFKVNIKTGKREYIGRQYYA